MSEKGRKITRWMVWTFFGAWNILLLFIISGKQDPKVAQQPQIIHIEQKAEAAQEEITINAKKSAFTFAGPVLKNVKLNEYKNAVDSDEKYSIINKDDSVKIAWSGNTATPTDSTAWNKTIEPNCITFSWKNNENVTFVQKWVFDDAYGIQINIEIINASNRAISVTPLLHMQKKEFAKGQSFIFSGISVYAQKSMNNYSASANKTAIFQGTPDSWAAFNEKYWLVAAHSKNLAIVSIDKVSNDKKHAKDAPYNIQTKNQEITANSNQTATSNFVLYVGPKEMHSLKKFGADHNISNIENTIDYGWLFFLTKPVNYVLRMLIDKLASVVLALIVITVLCKIITWPFTRSSHLAIKKINALTPAINEIKFKFKNSPEVMNKEVFALYKKHKINPISGCLPSFLQMLLLFPLYKVLSLSIDLRFASFPGWIKDLSSQDPTSIVNLFGLLSFPAPEALHIGLWPLLMGISMLVQQLLSATTQVRTREQQMMQFGLPVLFTWMMSSLPAGVVIYWTLTNFMTILQILWLDYSQRKRGLLVK